MLSFVTVTKPRPPLRETEAMPASVPFDDHHADYEAWFDKHQAAYMSELLALRPFVPWQGFGLEIGVGSGRFAAPLGVQVGLDPSPAMLRHAAGRGVHAVQGFGEQLPFANRCFDHVLMVTSLCFLASVDATLAETRRVLAPRGSVVIGFIDRDSAIGQQYLERQAQSVFYRGATFHSANEVAHMLATSGFTITAWGQTLSRQLDQTQQIESLRPGHGQGGFVVVTASSRQ